MSLLPSFKRIIVEDFDEKDRNLVGKIAGSVNTFADDVLRVLTKNVDIDNLAQTVKDITVTLDSKGVPVVPARVKTELSSACKGMQVIRVTNLDNPALFATSTPFVNYSDVNGLVTINNITDLSPGTRWKVRVIFYP